MKRWQRWLCALPPLLVVADYWAYPAFARPSGRVVNQSENALWLRYTWYSGRERDLGGLAARLRAHRIRDAYFHVRSVEPSGRLKYRFPVRRLNDEMRRLAPEVRRIAWIFAGDARAPGGVELDRRSVRANMVAEAARLVREEGFDGVQWDYEICPDDDSDFLRLLQDTRAALPKGAFLGTAVPTWYPPPLGGFGWSERYFREVARRCDGMAVMAYDSATYAPRLYVGWVTQQVVRTTRATAGTGCRVVVGLPTYDGGTKSHNPCAENLRLGLQGVRNGLASSADLSAWQGVGLFADYTTDDEEWRTFDRLWPPKE